MPKHVGTFLKDARSTDAHLRIQVYFKWINELHGQNRTVLGLTHNFTSVNIRRATLIIYSRHSNLFIFFYKILQLEYLFN